jgi:glucose-1-phosphate thymidylyltransferase
MGVDDITIVTGGYQLSQFQDLVGNGEEFDCKVNYVVQNESLGVADAIYQAKQFCEGEPVVVVLGDNIYMDDLSDVIHSYNGGCELFLKEVSDPERFGVPTLKGDKIIRITEKPEHPDSNYAVTGLYVFDENLFKYIEEIVPSDRGEYEVTDITNTYLERSSVKANFLKDEWLDAGTFESLYRANQLVRSRLFGNERKSSLKNRNAEQKVRTERAKLN